MKRAALTQIDLQDPDATRRLGFALAHTLPAQAVIALSSTLGGGKTTLVQAVAEATGVAKSAATSPTFTLVQTYQANQLIHHLDAYRLADEDEFLELGGEEIMESAGWIFIEWAEKIESMIPPDALWIELEVVETGRRATLRGDETRWGDVAREIARQWQ